MKVESDNVFQLSLNFVNQLEFLDKYIKYLPLFNRILRWWVKTYRLHGYFLVRQVVLLVIKNNFSYNVIVKKLYGTKI